MMIKSVEVVGDSGAVYTITTLESGEVICTCPDHLMQTMRGRMNYTCKHIRFIAACFAVPVG